MANPLLGSEETDLNVPDTQEVVQNKLVFASDLVNICVIVILTL